MILECNIILFFIFIYCFITGSVAYATCCSYPDISCRRVSSLPTTLGAGDYQGVTCPYNTTMVSCSYFAPDGRSGGARIIGKFVIPDLYIRHHFGNILLTVLKKLFIETLSKLSRLSGSNKGKFTFSSENMVIQLINYCCWEVINLNG